MGGLQGPKRKFWLDTCLELVETSTRFGFGGPPQKVSRAPVFLFVSSTRVNPPPASRVSANFSGRRPLEAGLRGFSGRPCKGL